MLILMGKTSENKLCILRLDILNKRITLGLRSLHLHNSPEGETGSSIMDLYLSFLSQASISVFKYNIQNYGKG